jgi:RNA 2',3'-cyclic 3'-phosphodiesterase
VRLFFALWPDADVIRQFASAASQLTLQNAGRLVNPENYHLTLAFVGEVADASLAVLQQIGRTQRASCCNIAFNGVDYWPESKVIVAAAEESPDSLRDLSAQLYEAVVHHQLKTALPRPQLLRAHVTLARKVSQVPVLPALAPFVWHVNRFSLMRSDTRSAQSIYTVLDTWPLLYER